jgi:hypothetical protein
MQNSARRIARWDAGWCLEGIKKECKLFHRRRLALSGLVFHIGMKTSKEKGAPNGAPFKSHPKPKAQLPVAESTETETPGPIVEERDTFFM